MENPPYVKAGMEIRLMTLTPILCVTMEIWLLFNKPGRSHDDSFPAVCIDLVLQVSLLLTSVKLIHPILINFGNLKRTSEHGGAHL